MKQMKKEEVLGIIMEEFEGGEQERNDFYGYLVGDRDEHTASLEKIDFTYFWRLNELCFDPANAYDEETQAIIYRLIYIVSEKKPGILITSSYKDYNSPPILKEAGVKEYYMKQDCMYRIENCFDYRFKYKGTRELNEWLCDVNKYYPECVTYFLNQQPLFNKQEQLATLVFMANEVKQHPTSEYLLTMQKWMLSLMTMTFGTDKVRSVYRAFGKYKEIENILENPLSIVLSEKEPVLFYLCNCFPESEEVLKEMARLTMVLLDRNFLRSYYHYWRDTHRIVLWKQLEVPKELYLLYACEILNLCSNSSIQEACEEIEALVKENKAELIALLEKQLERQEICGINLLGIMLNHQLLSKDQASSYLKWADDVLIAQVSDLFKAAQKEWGFEPSVEVLLAELPKPEFDSRMFAKYEEEFIRQEKGFLPWSMAAIGLMNYSVVANNMVKLLVSHLHNYTLLYSYFDEKYLYYSQLEAKAFLEDLYHKGFRLEKLIEVVLCQYCVDLSYNSKKVIIDESLLYDFLLRHQEELESLVQEMPFDSETMSYLLRLLYKDKDDFNDKILVSALKNKNKKVVLRAEELLLSREQTVREEIEAISRGKGKASVDAACRLLRQWDNEKMEKKLQEIETIESLEAFIAKAYTKAHEKNVPYSDVIDYKQVREKNSENYVSEELIKYFIAEYIMLKDFYRIKTCNKISDMVNLYDLQSLLQQLYSHWVTEGATITYKNILFPYSLLATPTQLTVLKKQIDEWSTNGKPALAAFGVQCLCMNGSKLALLWTDSLSKKHKNKKVREAAEEVMDRVCEEWQMSQDALEDEIVPDFEFDSQSVRYFDYGQRKIKATLNQDLSIGLFDETGKAIRSLPKASEKHGDVKELVNAAIQELKSIKKELPRVIDQQALRMTKAIFTGRSWNLNKWTSLFVENPLMRTFATGLIWEERDPNGQLRGTFRYMEDGTFNDVKEEEYRLAEGSTITLLHPADLTKEEIVAWQTQLEDYEVEQPISQLTLYRGDLDKDQEELQELSTYKGKQVYGTSLRSIATKLGFSMCFDGYGYCEGIYFYDQHTGIQITTAIEPFALSDYTQVVSLSSFKFQKEENSLSLKSVPKRLLSLACYIGDELSKKALEVNTGE